MANQSDVRRIAMSLPGAREEQGRFAFSVENKGKARGFAWVWLERIHPKKARVPCPSVLAVRVADQGEKAALLAADPDTFFTEPHYNGYPAVLVRLPRVTRAELRALLAEAWRCVAPKHLVEGDPPPRAPRQAASRRAAARPAARRSRRAPPDP